MYTQVFVFLDRNKILENILDLEAQMKIMKKNPAHKVSQRNLRYLEEKRFGSKVVTVESPDDSGVKLSMRRHSQEFKNTILRYREKQTEFNEQMNVLTSRRKRLIKQLFPS
jgi:hypothetical protein